MSLHLVNIQPNLKPHPPPKFSGSDPGDERSKFSIVNRSFNKKQCKTINNFSMLSGLAMRCRLSIRLVSIYVSSVDRLTNLSTPCEIVLVKSLF